MATIKFCTDIEQSRKLAEILPHESADMWYSYFGNPKYNPTIAYKGHQYCLCQIRISRLNDIPCWSLTALLNVLRIFTMPTAFSVKVSTPSLIKTENGYKLTYTGDYTPMINNELDVEAPIESIAENAVDACVTMVEKLHELKML